MRFPRLQPGQRLTADLVNRMLDAIERLEGMTADAASGVELVRSAGNIALRLNENAGKPAADASQGVVAVTDDTRDPFTDYFPGTIEEWTDGTLPGFTAGDECWVQGPNDEDLEEKNYVAVLTGTHEDGVPVFTATEAPGGGGGGGGFHLTVKQVPTFGGSVNITDVNTINIGMGGASGLTLSSPAANTAQITTVAADYAQYGVVTNAQQYIAGMKDFGDGLGFPARSGAAPGPEGALDPVLGNAVLGAPSSGSSFGALSVRLRNGTWRCWVAAVGVEMVRYDGGSPFYLRHDGPGDTTGGVFISTGAIPQTNICRFDNNSVFVAINSPASGYSTFAGYVVSQSGFAYWDGATLRQGVTGVQPVGTRVQAHGGLVTAYV